MSSEELTTDSQSLVSPIPTPKGWKQKVWLGLQIIQVRLRFLVVIAVGFLVVGQWDRIRTYFDRWVDSGVADPSKQAVSVDTEYFCPMDPGVLSDWPSKCPICNMTLVRRKR